MITKDFNEAHEEVVKLVATFGDNHTKYMEPQYNESAARKDFIDKLFIALGWDVNHNTQTNPYEQEVKVEKNVSVAARVKKADYAFFLKPNFTQERFFVEAKRPSTILDTPDNCFQTIRYAFSSAKAALSVLTNFNELYIIDCRFRPDIQTATNHIHKRFHFSDFYDVTKFGEFYYLFSREAVEAGKLDEYALTLPKPKGKVVQRRLFGDSYQEVDDAFLVQLEVYREELAKMFKRKNTQLDSDSLTEAVQRTIDRLVFIRFLEDKLIEPSTILDKLSDEPHPWKKFIAKSREFDKTYNGIIFKEHPVIDRDDFVVDNRVFNDITDSLADKYSPYHFNYIPIHILGSIYERFLGSVIVATAKRATVEQKPEVRKAGGVFYTPQYIVKYIVENTIGELLKGKTPDEVAGMRFADIACGSGSFLLGAYEYLLGWHTAYYNGGKNKTQKEKRRSEAKKAGCITNDDSTFALSFEQKKEILVKNLFGVDIDRQAYEVTQLSLFLKLLEDETQGTKQQFLTGHRESLLPDLRNNIVCGNALVDWDINGSDLFEQIDNDKQIKLNPMSFEQKFPEIMRAGGFDAIIGNPPYVRQELLGKLKDYLRKKYKTYHGVADLYVFFIERYVSLLRSNGEFGIIVASKWLRSRYGEPLRKFLRSKEIVEIVDFVDRAVFKNATTYTCVLRVRNAEQKQKFFVTKADGMTSDGPSLADFVAKNRYPVEHIERSDGGWSLSQEAAQLITEKIGIRGIPLKKYVNGEIYYGIKTGFNEAFVIDEETKAQLIAQDSNSAQVIKPFLVGRNIKRYTQPYSDNYVIFTRRGIDIKKYPAIEAHLSKYKTSLLPKPSIWKDTDSNGKENKWPGRKGGKYQWYEIQDTVDYYEKFEKTKILWPGISDVVTSFAMDEQGYYGNDNNQLVISDSKYLLGLMNSRVANFFLRNICDVVQGGFYRLKMIYVELLPIVDYAHHDDGVAMHDVIVRSVEQIMEAKLNLAAASSDRDRDFWQNKCDSLERTIDHAVYKLYNLTPEEIALVEKG